MKNAFYVACAVMLSPLAVGWSLDFDQNINVLDVMEEVKSAKNLIPIPEAKPVDVKTIHYPPKPSTSYGNKQTYSSVRVYEDSTAMMAALEIVLHQITNLDGAHVISYEEIKLEESKFSFKVSFRAPRTRRLEVYTAYENERTARMLLDTMEFNDRHRIDGQVFKLEHNDRWCCAIVWLIRNEAVMPIPPAAMGFYKP